MNFYTVADFRPEDCNLSPKALMVAKFLYDEVGPEPLSLKTVTAFIRNWSKTDSWTGDDINNAASELVQKGFFVKR